MAQEIFQCKCGYKTNNSLSWCNHADSCDGIKIEYCEGEDDIAFDFGFQEQYEEIAKKLVEKYFIRFHRGSNLELSWKECIQCALFAVEELLNEILLFGSVRNGRYQHWNEIKTSLEKMSNEKI